MHAGFVVIFGTRWHFEEASGGWDGILNCPDCGVPTRFVEKEARKAFTLYWWPLWSTEAGGRLVECQQCQGRFQVPPELGGPGGPEADRVRLRSVDSDPDDPDIL